VFKLKLSGGTDPAAYNASISKYDEVLRFVNDNYFEPADNNKLAESAIKGLLEGLDPHSFYIPAAEMKAIDE
jgi:carboxyl-terminal processing protease